MVKKYSLFGILAILFLALVAVIVYLIIGFGSAVGILPQGLYDESKELSLEDTQRKPQWQDKFISLSSKDYSPATQRYSMSFHVDKSGLEPKSKFYQLIVDKNDLYSLFCLKQTLNAFSVKYNLTHVDKNTEIFLDTDNITLLESIQKELKKYNINTQVKEIWL
ncbi:hypothetical protein DMB92_01165 [Campylobacter sp. MIT 99-7217]|uniref:hypothetical protein n=1 Tax=Campylobacter sp. MIT 99-7217 TaxID=535091 RepID=UPI001156E87E|nr:hypothetical protein [Campylobacter sp. MIT 99-7217]TQR34603.1 hypothetical protein DMB92_01165 [Campylobacter sp. MIT 99-7217]